MWEKRSEMFCTGAFELRRDGACEPACPEPLPLFMGAEELPEAFVRLLLDLLEKGPVTVEREPGYGPSLLSFSRPGVK